MLDLLTDAIKPTAGTDNPCSRFPAAAAPGSELPAEYPSGTGYLAVTVKCEVTDAAPEALTVTVA